MKKFLFGALTIVLFQTNMAAQAQDFATVQDQKFLCKVVCDRTDGGWTFETEYETCSRTNIQAQGEADAVCIADAPVLGYESKGAEKVKCTKIRPNDCPRRISADSDELEVEYYYSR